MMEKHEFGLIGCGAIGTELARAFDSGVIKGRLTHVYDADEGRARALADSMKQKPEVSASAAYLIGKADFVIEAASQDAVREYALDSLKAGKSMLVMSVGALLDQKFKDRLVAEAERTSSVIHIPAGALAGIDGISAAALTRMDEVTLTTTKPPAGLKGVKYLLGRGLDVDLITHPTVVFEGSSEDVVRHFPKNVNVAATVSLASGKPVNVRVVADPKARANTHEIHARGAFGEINVKAQNLPSPTNPATSQLAALSAISVLKGLCERIRIGG